MKTNTHNSAFEPQYRSAALKSYSPPKLQGFGSLARQTLNGAGTCMADGGGASCVVGSMNRNM
jgi:hypothetical protein